MKPRCDFSESKLATMQQQVRMEPRLVALYALGLHRPGDCDLAALFTETPSWPERLDLELMVARSLELDGVELVDLRRMPLAFRFWVLNHGEPIYVGKPHALARFVEETVARYSAFYPLLEALYWKVETGPLAEDMLDQ